MLSPYDDYLVHQTSAPVLHPVNGDPSFYERYYATGFAPDASAHFGFGLSVYPNTGIVDAALSISRDGVQESVFCSDHMPSGQRVAAAGPVHVEVLDPLKRIRITLAETDGVSADITYAAHSAPMEEQRLIRTRGTTTASDRTRFVQFGSWKGSIVLDGESIDVGGWHGVRDRSWGVRRQATAEDVRDPAIKPIHAVWSVMHFPDDFVQVTLHEAPDGVAHARLAMQTERVLEPDVGAHGPVSRTDDVSVAIDYIPGTRRPANATIDIGPRGPLEFTIDVNPQQVFQMKGLGYYHSGRPHGFDHGGLSIARERWEISQLDPLRKDTVHAQQLAILTRSDGVVGVGLFEHVAMGPHGPSGLPDGLEPPISRTDY